jgi:hypothetical protein
LSLSLFLSLSLSLSLSLLLLLLLPVFLFVLWLLLLLLLLLLPLPLFNRFFDKKYHQEIFSKSKMLFRLVSDTDSADAMIIKHQDSIVDDKDERAEQRN